MADLCLLHYRSKRGHLTNSEPMLDWLGDEGKKLQAAFAAVLGDKPRPFGKQATQIGGFSDGNDGVQWNAGYDPRDRKQWLGVNLEGMKYDDWPIARLITRELQRPTLPRLVRDVGHTDPAVASWKRDYWQVAARPSIREGSIKPTPILLSRLTEEGWREALDEAFACLLDRRPQNWTRATQQVTLDVGGREVIGPVSPHLTLVFPAAVYTPWQEFLTQAKARMQPFYEWAVEVSV